MAKFAECSELIINTSEYVDKKTESTILNHDVTVESNPPEVVLHSSSEELQKIYEPDSMTRGKPAIEISPLGNSRPLCQKLSMTSDRGNHQLPTLSSSLNHLCNKEEESWQRILSSPKPSYHAARHKNLQRGHQVGNDISDDTFKALVRLPGWPPHLSLVIDENQVLQRFDAPKSLNSPADKKKCILHIIKNRDKYTNIDNALYIQPIRGDGDCFYNAVLQGLTSNERKGFLSACANYASLQVYNNDVSIIRHAAVAYIWDNFEKIAPYLSFTGSIEEHLIRFTDNLSQNGNWYGEHGDLIPFIITQLPGWPAGRSIEIYTEPDVLISKFPSAIQQEESKPAQPVKLHLHGNHYNLLLPAASSNMRSGLKAFHQGSNFFHTLLTSLDHEQRALLLNKASLRTSLEDELILKELISSMPPASISKEEKENNGLHSFELNKVAVAVWENLSQLGVTALTSLAQSQVISYLPFPGVSQVILSLYKLSNSVKNKETLLGFFQLIKFSVNLGVLDGRALNLLGDLAVEYLGSLGKLLLEEDIISSFLSKANIPLTHLAIFLIWQACSSYQYSPAKKESQEEREVGKLFSILSNVLAWQGRIAGLVNATPYPFFNNQGDDIDTSALAWRRDHIDLAMDLATSSFEPEYDSENIFTDNTKELPVVLEQNAVDDVELESLHEVEKYPPVPSASYQQVSSGEIAIAIATAGAMANHHHNNGGGGFSALGAVFAITGLCALYYKYGKPFLSDGIVLNFPANATFEDKSDIDMPPIALSLVGREDKLVEAINSSLLVPESNRETGIAEAANFTLLTKKQTKFVKGLRENAEHNLFIRNNPATLRHLAEELGVREVYLAENSTLFNLDSINNRINNTEGELSKNKFLVEKEYIDHFINAYIPQDIHAYGKAYVVKLIDKMKSEAANASTIEEENGTRRFNKWYADIIMFQSLYEKAMYYQSHIFFLEFSQDEIYFYTELRYILNNIYQAINAFPLIDGDMLANKREFEYVFKPLLKSGEALSFIYDVTSPYLEENSSVIASYLDILKLADDFDMSYLTKTAIHGVSQSIKLNSDMFIPFAFHNSPLLQFIENSTHALSHLLLHFGRCIDFEYFRHSDNKSVIIARENIQSALNASSELNRDGYWWEDVDNFVSKLNFTVLRSASKGETDDSYAVSLYQRYNSNINNLLQGFLDSLSEGDVISADKTVPDNIRYAMQTLRQLMNNNNQSLHGYANEQQNILRKVIDGSLSYAELNNIGNRNVLIDFIYNHVFLSALEKIEQRRDFSIHALSVVLDFDFLRLANISMSTLFYNEVFSHHKNRYLSYYDEDSVDVIEKVINHFIDISERNDSLSLSHLLGAMVSDVTKVHAQYITLIESEIPIEEVFFLSELYTAVSLYLKDIEPNDTLLSFTEGAIKPVRNALLKHRDDTYNTILTANLDKKNADKNLQILKRDNLLILFLDIVLQERAELIDLANGILQQCKNDSGVLKPTLVDFSGDHSDLDAIHLSKIAAVKYLYGENLTKNESDTLLSNVFDSAVFAEAEEAEILRELSALYWLFFSHPTFKYSSQHLMPYLLEDNKHHFGEHFSQGENKEKAEILKALISFTTTSSLVRIQDIYQQQFSGQAAALERLLSGKDLTDTYYSLNNIKRRSEIEGHSLEAFAAQFTKYHQDDSIDKDVKVILGNTLRKSGVDLKMLQLPPKKIWRYTHLNKRFETRERPWVELNINGRDDDLIIIKTQDNDFVISFASVFFHDVEHAPDFSDQTGIYASGYFIRDFSDSELSTIKFRYNLEQLKNDSFSGAYPDVLAMDVSQFGRDAADLIKVGFYSDFNREMLLFKKSSSNSPDKATVEDIIKQQTKAFLEESSKNMQTLFNDEEDTWGYILGFVPFASAIRSGANKQPLTRAEIAFVVVDVSAAALGLSGRAAKKAFEGSTRDAIKNVVTRFFKGKGGGPVLTAESAIQISGQVMKNLLAKGFMASYITLSELVMMTPAPLIWTSGKYVIKLGAKGGRNFVYRARNVAKKIGDKPDVYFRHAKQRAEYMVQEGIYQRMGDEFMKTAEVVRPQYMLGDGEYVLPHVEYQQQVQQQAQIWIQHYQQRIARANTIQWTQADMTPAEVLLDVQQDFPGIIILNADANGLAEIRQRLGNMVSTRMSYIIPSIAEVNRMMNKANRLYAEALQPHNPLYNHLAADLHSVTGVRDRGATENLLWRMSQRNHLVSEMIQYYSNYPENIKFLIHNQLEPERIAFTYVNDMGRTMFVNARNEMLGVHRVILHESSHHTGTLDFLYQTNNEAGQAERTGSLIRKLTSLNTVAELGNGNYDFHVRILLEVDPNMPLFPAHYQAAFDIIHDPVFPESMLLNNADSYTDFVDYLDAKYSIAHNGEIIINERHRSARDIRVNKEIAFSLLGMIFGMVKE